jgi:hypothetical protein
MALVKQAFAIGLVGVWALGCALPTWAASSLATLQLASGKVMVSQGDGFVSADAGLPLRAGDRIMVGDGAKAEIAFGNCAVTVAPQSLFVVPAKAPCAKGEAMAFVESGFIQPTVGNIGTFPPAYLFAFGGAIVGLGAIAFLAAGYDEPDPASTN